MFSALRLEFLTGTIFFQQETDSGELFAVSKSNFQSFRAPQSHKQNFIQPHCTGEAEAEMEIWKSQEMQTDAIFMANITTGEMQNMFL